MHLYQIPRKDTLLISKPAVLLDQIDKIISENREVLYTQHRPTKERTPLFKIRDKFLNKNPLFVSSINLIASGSITRDTPFLCKFFDQFRVDFFLIKTLI